MNNSNSIATVSFDVRLDRQLPDGGQPEVDRHRAEHALECISDESYGGEAATERRRDRH